jgi:radical SAM-linked protein
MSDAVQRWRIVHRRGPSTRDLAQREELEAWEAAVAGSGLPVATDGRGRPKLGSGIPLPRGLTAEAERLDVYLLERRTAREVRAAVAAAAPEDHPLVEVHDVWLGAPALAACVVAADYRLTLDGANVRTLADAAAALLAAERLERSRVKGDRLVTYDLRPLLADVRVDDARVRMRLRADPVQGVGRPDEVVAAMADVISLPLALVEGSRERIWLVDEVAPPLA